MVASINAVAGVVAVLNNIDMTIGLQDWSIGEEDESSETVYGIKSTDSVTNLVASDAETIKFVYLSNSAVAMEFIHRNKEQKKGIGGRLYNGSFLVPNNAKLKLVNMTLFSANTYTQTSKAVDSYVTITFKGRTEIDRAVANFVQPLNDNTLDTIL